MKEVPNRKAKLMGSVSVSRATDGTPPRREITMKLSTINKIVEAILSQTKSDIKLVHDDTKHKIINSNLSEIKKTERFLREKGVKDIDIAVTLPQKPKGSEMFPVNY